MDYKIIKRRSNIQLNEESIVSIANQFNISELSASLLMKKGLSTIGQIEEYLFPKKEYLHNPYLFRDMDKTVARILNAIRNQEQIVIYGDYDCDGICSSVILFDTLSYLGGHVITFLPDRFVDGYGMNITRMKQLIQQGAQLIITVDNGIVAFDEVEYANRRQVDVIITDHHTPDVKLPEAFSILNPKITYDSYPYEELCGAGVALKLAEALLNENLPNELLVLACIATIADIVPLTGENRTITSIGLELLPKSNNVGLNELISLAGLNIQAITSGTISFQIAPRINAAGRLYSAADAFKLLTTKDPQEAREIAEKLEQANNERKNIEETLFNEAESTILTGISKNRNVIFINIKDAHEGVIGIVAGKICEKYNRPTIVCSESNSLIKASARSIQGINIHDLLAHGYDLYEKFGGHSQAAGFSISTEKYPILVERIEQEAEGLSNSFFKSAYYDLEAVSSQLSEKAVSELNLFAPYGMKNPHPVYLLRGAAVRNISRMGSKKEHLRANIVHKNCNFQSVGFFMGDLADAFFQVNNTYDILFTPSINTYKQKRTLQLEIKEAVCHVPIEAEYYTSFYNYFIWQYESGDSFIPSTDKIIELTKEKALDNFENYVFIVFDEDTLCRAIRYTKYLGVESTFHYNYFNEINPQSVNFWIHPISFNKELASSIQVIVLDMPDYFSNYPSVLQTIENIVFLKSVSHNEPYHINRSMIAFVYKKLRYLDAIGNDFNSFIGYLNNESEYSVNYFTVRLILDILTEMEILEYEMIHEKIYIEFKKITKQKDVFDSSIMIKLMRV